VQLTITPDAASDLRERVARSSGDAVLIIGPVRPSYSMAESAEEAEHLEIAYGLAQPWRLSILSLKEFVRLRDRGGTNVYATNLDGIPALVITPQSDAKLFVERDGDKIQISTNDA
jgi:glutaredoxin-related protein